MERAESGKQMDKEDTEDRLEPGKLIKVTKVDKSGVVEMTK